jgi:hypothetical protein
MTKTTAEELAASIHEATKRGDAFFVIPLRHHFNDPYPSPESVAILAALRAPADLAPGLRRAAAIATAVEENLVYFRVELACEVAANIRRKILDAIQTGPAEPAGAAPPFDFAAHLARQRAFSEKTFGPGVRTKGVVDHIRKELAEIEADPFDISEWIDVVILALDGAWRAGYSPTQIIEAIVAKQAKNEGRIWPDWRTMPGDQAIEHDRTAEPAAEPTAGLYTGGAPKGSFAEGAGAARSNLAALDAIRAPADPARPADDLPEPVKVYKTGEET